jgi:DNA-binding YbaB/EbfC family protein
MVNINQIMKQAQEMQKKMADMQADLATKAYEGNAGGGMVKVTINGKLEMQSLKIDPSIVDVDDLEMLEDLIKAAFNDAKKKFEEDSSSTMSQLLGGMGLPAGFKLPGA